MDLGRRLSSHGPTHPTLKPLFSAAIVLFFAVFGTLLLVEAVLQRDLGGRVFMGGVGLVSLLLAVIMAKPTWQVWRTRKDLVHLHEGGVVFEGAGTPSTRPWSDFAAAGATRVRTNGVETSHHMDIRFNDGTSCQLAGLKDQNPLFEVIGRHAPPLHYDPATLVPRQSAAVDSLPAVVALGRRLSSHRYETKTHLVFSIIGLVVLGGSFAAMAFVLAAEARRPGDWVPVVPVSALALMLVGFYVRRIVRHRAESRDVIHVHERGLVLERSRGLRIVRWEEIRSASRLNTEMQLALGNGDKELLVAVDGFVALFAMIESRVSSVLPSAQRR